MTAEEFQFTSNELLKRGLSREDFHTRLALIYSQCVCRPFPSGSIITEIVSKAYPSLHQKQVYCLVQVIKQLCAEQDLPPAPSHGNN
jgi:hypothetical protein